MPSHNFPSFGVKPKLKQNKIRLAALLHLLNICVIQFWRGGGVVFCLFLALIAFHRKPFGCGGLAADLVLLDENNWVNAEVVVFILFPGF